MGQPSEFTPAQDYADYQTNNPGSFVAGSDLDVDFAAVKTTLDQIRANLALLQKDDGTIANSTVTVDSLNADLLALFTIGASTIRGQWLTATDYVLLDVVTDSGIVYVCAEDHTSGVLATDVTAVKWLVLSGGSQPLDTDLTAIAALVSAADKVPYSTGSGTWSLASFTAYARTLLALSSKAAVVAELNAAVTNAANTFTATPQIIRQSDDGASAGPVLQLDRLSASPAANDFLGMLDLRGRDDGGNVTQYATILTQILDPTDGSEDAVLHIRSIIAATLATRVLVGAGLYTPGATGGDKGMDTINAEILYQNNVALDDRIVALSPDITAGTPCVKNPMVADTLTTTAHGLGANPSWVNAYLECIATDAGYSVGDRLHIGQLRQGVATDDGVVFLYNETNCEILMGTAVATVGKATFNAATITLSKWKAVVQPYLVS